MEDNRADVYLLKRALQKAEINFTPIVFEDGESAYRYIDRAPGPEMKALPDVVILDLNVPKRDGSEVLAHIRLNNLWRNIAVVILSSSPKQDMQNRTAQADCYITKPNGLNEFLEIGGEIRQCFEAVRAGRRAL